ncbi:hypothetical protein AB0I84_07805 [Streptomyces spectabilis]
MPDRVPEITPSEPDEWPEPTPAQLDLVRRILAPHIYRARAERQEPNAA